eukprot:CAMPEP_0178733116 /NCGR_PEP_ID=MMETSP0744-20121128/622_1 /TAXON_ID=913974 /ORGANISM="Nitzschia punctata, Strain CCMP561" /LENGTH=225 /DNA_ID=CAMNT_0020385275 /DNA_START=183 /DNA_END=860 /DNA_ORIENTATION=-
MRRAKIAIKQAEQLQLQHQNHSSNSKPQKGGKKKGKNKKLTSNGAAPNQNTNNSTPTPEDEEDDFEFLLLNVKRGLCRGLVRFFAALKQAGLVQENEYEFTSNQRIFEKRYEPFAAIQQPPPLSYDDYLKGSDFSKVPQKDLLASTSECFNVSKSMIEKLLAQIPTTDPSYLPIQEDELRQLAKVCVGNSIYLQKLKQIIGEGTTKASVSIDVNTNKQFCTIKIG